MYKSLEHREHAEHLAHHGATPATDRAGAEPEHTYARSSQLAALLVAVLAATLAISEQGARHAEIRLQENAVFATDAWAQYQAKSTRAALSKDVAAIISVLGTGDSAIMERRAVLLGQLRQDQERFESDPGDGKTAIATRARGFEAVRDTALEQTHAYHNASAAMELGIVLATASAIIRARPLILMALAIGIAGVVFSVLGLLAPELGAI